MQDGAQRHIGYSVQHVLRQHFSDSRMISRVFRTAWPQRSPDLNYCDFWLWGFLKGVFLSRTCLRYPNVEESNNVTCEANQL